MIHRTKTRMMTFGGLLLASTALVAPLHAQDATGRTSCVTFRLGSAPNTLPAPE